MNVKILLAACCVGLTTHAEALHGEKTSSTNEKSTYLLVGCYGSDNEETIKTYHFNELTGEAIYIGGLSGLASPSHLISSADGTRVYAVSEDNGKHPMMAALSFEQRDGQLALLNSQPASGGLPCYAALSPEGHFALTANYMGGSITVYPLDAVEKLLPETHQISFTGTGSNPLRQETPHLHCLAFTPDNRFLWANDLGSDHVYLIPVRPNEANRSAASLLDEEAMVSLNMEPGSGPRHLCFHPNGKFAYLLSELSGEITVFAYGDGRLTRLQSLVCDPYRVDGGADIHVSADGRFVYASRRLKEDGVLIYAVNPEKGTLTQIGFQPTGLYPRHFTLSPDGRYLVTVCRDSDCVQIFSRNPETGLLTHTEQTLHVHKPACVLFLH